MSVLWQKRTHGVPRRRRQWERTVAIAIVALTLVVTLLILAYLTLVASNVRLARQIWEVGEAVMTQERVNEALRVEIARQSAIPRLQERSLALGFVPAEKVDFVRLDEEGGER